jgi:hypothetical protein
MCLKFRTEIGKTLEFNHEFTIKRELPKNQVSPLHIWYRLFTVHREHPGSAGVVAQALSWDEFRNICGVLLAKATLP